MTSKVNSRKAAVKRMQARARRRRSGSRLSTLSSRPFAGFTLVEMLVAVALVLLMMTLFAQIFQLAGGSVSTQRGIMENDQRARTAQILLSGDLNKRTFRFVVPFAFNEDTGAPEAALQKRQGYFYISENGTANDTDDVLAFTVDARITTDSPDQLDYYGRALPLWFSDPSVMTPDNPIPTSGANPPTPPRAPSGLAPRYWDDYWFRLNSNQPEADDRRLDYNQSATSPAAEVCYFLRNGNLYRRVLLIRQPASGNANEEQPTDAIGQRFFSRDYYPPANGGPMPAGKRFPYNFSTGFDDTGARQGVPVNFWQHFDFSGHPRIIADTGMPPQYYYDGVTFNGLSSLQMTYSVNTFPYTASPPSFQSPLEIAYPANRFGHNTLNPMPLSGGGPVYLPFGGLPREYGVTGGTTAWWVGRPTMEETSDASMQYPMLAHAIPNSTSDANNDFNTASLWEDTNNDRVIDVYAGGPWRGEDLLLTNVHSFDVKVWDETLGQFADIGHALTTAGGVEGDFHINNRRNNIYGPSGATSRVFDTWYPFRTEDIDGDFILDVTEDDDSDGTLDGGEDNDGDGVLDLPEDGKTVGEIDGQLLDFNADGTITMADTDPYGDGADGLVDFGENVPPYRPLVALPKPGVSGSYSASTGPTRFPRWVANTSATSDTWYPIGARVFPAATPQSAQFGDPFYYVCVGVDDINGDGMYPHGTTEPNWQRTAGLKTYDGDLIWQAVDNRKPLRAIQITLRFIDPTTGQMRTLTLQHALVD